MECPGKVYVRIRKQRALKLTFPSLAMGLGAIVNHSPHPYCAGETEAWEHRALLNSIQLTCSREGTEMQQPEALIAILGLKAYIREGAMVDFK